MTASDPDLFGDFPRRYLDDWERLAEPTLKGKKLDTLVERGLDGVDIEPLYTRQAWPADKDPAGLPGFFPYTRGNGASGPVREGWGIGQRYTDPVVDRLARAIETDVAAGVNHVVIAAPVETTNDATRILEAIGPASLTIDVDEAFETSAVFVAASEQRDRPLVGNLGLDPLHTLLVTGALAVDVDDAFRLVTDIAHRIRGQDNLRTVLVRGDAYENGGSTPAQQLAYAMATGLTYLRALLAEGFSIRDANAQIAFRLAAGPDVFRTIATLRAARTLWSRITGACGARDAARRTSIEVITSRHALTKHDVWVNVLRGTTAAFGAAAGGAEQIVVRSHVDALGVPDDTARRIAKNVQIILRDEVGLGRVIDPAGGAWALETLTDNYARTAWRMLQEVEGQGGVERAIESGFVRRKIEETRSGRTEAVAKRQQVITGVSDYPWLDEPSAVVLPVEETSPTSTADIVIPFNADRGRSIAAAVAHLIGGGSRADLAAALDRHETSARTDPLSPVRLAETFEGLRQYGRPFPSEPRVLLVSFGPSEAFTPRASFAQNFYACAGIRAVDRGGFDTPEAAATAAEDFDIAVLCSSDALYETEGVAYARAVKSTGLKQLFIAGRPGATSDRLQNAGVDGYVHLGVDALSMLKATLDGVKS